MQRSVFTYNNDSKQHNPQLLHRSHTNVARISERISGKVTVFNTATNIPHQCFPQFLRRGAEAAYYAHCKSDGFVNNSEVDTYRIQRKSPYLVVQSFLWGKLYILAKRLYVN
jgi:hypothetical protein